MKTRWIAFLVICGFLTGLDFSMAAEPGYPTKTIEVILGFSPGGGTDLSARMIAERAKQYLGQEVIIVNKPGGTGRVALTLVSKAKPDGYTLVALSDPGIVLIPHLEKVNYKPIDDFVFIIQYGLINLGVTVLVDSPFRSIKDLVEYARTNPDKLTISSSGADSPGAVAFQAIALREGVKIKTVPFSGGAAAATALLGGHITVASTAIPVLSPYLQAKQIRLLAVLGDERDNAYPEAPTLKELGYPIAFQSWYFIAGPRNLEKPVVKKLEEAFRKVIESPEYTKFAQDLLIWARNPLSDDDLRDAFIRRSKEHGEIFKNLGMGIK